MLFYVGEDGLKSGGAFIVKACAAITQQPCAVQEAIDHHGFKNIELKMPTGAANGYGNIIAHNLCRYHGESLALCGVYFARHNRRAGFIFGNMYFAYTAAWSGGEQADVVGNFHEAYCHGFSCAMCFYNGVVCCKGFKFIFGCYKW